MTTLKLKKPFSVSNGKEITELLLDFDALSVADFRQAKKLEAVIVDSGSFDLNDAVKGKMFTFEFQLASGFIAALKGTDGLTIDDFTRLNMADALALAQQSSFFWLGVD